MKNNLLIALIALVAIAGWFYPSAPEKLGGATNFDSVDTSDGYLVDGTSFVNGSGVLTGAITTSNAVTMSGTNTLSGNTTLSGTAKVAQSSSSTLQIGENSDGLLHGCIILGDSAGATSTPVYITATGATITATTTRPAAACKTSD